MKHLMYPPFVCQAVVCVQKITRPPKGNIVLKRLCRCITVSVENSVWTVKYPCLPAATLPRDIASHLLAAPKHIVWGEQENGTAQFLSSLEQSPKIGWLCKAFAFPPSQDADYGSFQKTTLSRFLLGSLFSLSPNGDYLSFFSK